MSQCRYRPVLVSGLASYHCIVTGVSMYMYTLLLTVKSMRLYDYRGT